MPTELLIEQLPQRLTVGEMAFQVNYTSFGTGDAVTGLLVIVRDVTEELQRTANERAQRETLALFQRIAADRGGVEDFLNEANGISRSLATEGDAAVQKRYVHTLKGNASMYGLEEFASACHELENELASADHTPEMTAVEKQSLIASWQVAAGRIGSLLGDGHSDKVEISAKELVRVIERAKGGASATTLASELAMWKLEPVERRLERLGRQAQSLAVRLGKPEVEIGVDGGGIRIDPALWGGVWASMLHVVRNAIDHGIEGESERLAADKQAAGQLKLLALRVDGDLLIEIHDDGRGVDWTAVHARAEHLGIPHSTQKELVDALFIDGFSTREEATATSGRGVGLSALRSVVADLGGAVEVDTAAGQGTTFRLRVPERNVKPKTQEILRMTAS